MKTVKNRIAENIHTGRHSGSAAALVLSAVIFSLTVFAAAAAVPSGSVAAVSHESSGNGKIYNNAGYFVKSGDRVWFRRYGADALEHSALWGDFLSGPQVAGKSEICWYDEKDNSVHEAFEDAGCGKIICSGGRLYLSEIVGHPAYKLYSVRTDGSGRKEIGDGQYVCCSDDGSIRVSANTTTGKNSVMTLTVSDDSGMIEKYGGKTDVEYLAAKNGYLFYEAHDFAKNQDLTIYCRKLTKTGKSVRLGIVDDVAEDSFLKIDQIRIKEKTVYISYESDAGTAAVYQGGGLMKGTLDGKDSLKKVKTYGPDTAGVPYIVLKGETYGTLSNESSDLYVDGTDGGLYLYDSLGESTQIAVVCDQSGTDSAQNLEGAEIVGDCVYGMRDTMIPDDENSVGWRQAYSLVSTEYIRIPIFDGRVYVMDTVQTGDDAAPAQDSGKTQSKMPSLPLRSGDDAVALVKMYLDDNAEYVPSVIEVDSETDEVYTVHAYDVVDDGGGDSHTATYNWYDVYKETGTVEPEF
ncbi:MAG: hypothetical protein LKJ76_01075 [Lachnospiraceae bacterium]|jgi:hypothetical protein|nr:hypothetical protein [Lachnospiraceae bacterium]